MGITITDAEIRTLRTDLDGDDVVRLYCGLALGEIEPGLPVCDEDESPEQYVRRLVDDDEIADNILSATREDARRWCAETIKARTREDERVPHGGWPT